MEFSPQAKKHISELHTLIKKLYEGNAMGRISDRHFERMLAEYDTEQADTPMKNPYIGHYGRLCKAYLEQYRPDLYIAYIASETLYEHCAEIEEAAQNRLDHIFPQLAKSAGATEELKAADQMKCVGLMNTCRRKPMKLSNLSLSMFDGQEPRKKADNIYPHT